MPPKRSPSKSRIQSIHFPFSVICSLGLLLFSPSYIQSKRKFSPKKIKNKNCFVFLKKLVFFIFLMAIFVNILVVPVG